LKRSKEKFPALNTNRQVFNRREYLDCDYIDKLTDEEKDFLNRFLEETYITNFDHKGKKFYKKKAEKKKLYHDNNSRNRCLLSYAKSKGIIDKLPDDNGVKSAAHTGVRDPGKFGEMEDALIDYIDSKNVPKEPEES
jgi:hypothetical protein